MTTIGDEGLHDAAEERWTFVARPDVMTVFVPYGLVRAQSRSLYPPALLGPARVTVGVAAAAGPLPRPPPAL